MDKSFLVALVAVVIALGAWFAPGQEVTLGGPTNYDTVEATGLAIGSGCANANDTCTGTVMTQILSGTGILIGPSYVSLVASTTLPFDIAVSGVVSGDRVLAQFATSSANGAGWDIVGASASTTSGFVTVRIVNNTGTTATIPASVASTTQYLIIR